MMKKILFSLYAVTAMASIAVAGGDIESVEPVAEPIVVVPGGEQNGFYAGFGLTGAAVRDSALSVSWSGSEGREDRLGNFTFIAGYDFNAYVAIEGRYTNSFTHEDKTDMEGWSLFVKPQYPVTENFSIYALLGYGGAKLDGKNGYNVDVDNESFQWGLGADYMITDSFSVFADYVWFANDMDGKWVGVDSVDIDTINVGVNYHF
jgi:opacity protein-like surface antigen